MACSMRAEVPCPAARLVVNSDPLSIRQGLEQLSQTALIGELTPPCRNIVEIVLAEVLNNIVEHAYANSSGKIEVEIQLADGRLHCRFADSGAPMPNGILPDGSLPVLDCTDPPEGGFGWHLIRTLADNLAYCRQGNRNLLCLSLNRE